MKIKTDELIATLIEKTKSHINKVEEFRKLTIIDLSHKENKESWSALECIEHLNLYAEFYNPEIKKRIEKNTTKANEMFNSGVIGNYFVKSMQPKEKLNKMKTAKDKNPVGSSLDLNVIDKFVTQQKELLELIKLSKNVDLNKTKTAITLTSFIKLKLGDTFRFLVAHNERHLLQAEKAILAIPQQNTP